MTRKLLVDKPYVEIGGIKWATMNIGANTETDYGLYFQWGDTAGYTSSQVGSSGTTYAKPFKWNDYKFGNGSGNSSATALTKYNMSSDTKKVLDACDDAAVANWGGNWRMPTTEEWQALGDATTSAWTQVNGVNGITLTDKTDSTKTLFFPAAGYCDNGRLGSGSSGCYWSSSLNSSFVINAYNMYFNSSSVNWQSNYNRSYGFPVRGVLAS